MKTRLELDMAALTRKAARMQAAAQALLKNEVSRGCDRYVPFQTGALRKSVKGSVNTPDPYLIYDCPYARYQYYGRVRAGPAPRQATGADLQYHTPGTGPQWFETWKAAGGREVIRRVKARAGRTFDGR